MRALTICQGRSHSSPFVWPDLSSLHNSMQSGSCWQQARREQPALQPRPPAPRSPITLDGKALKDGAGSTGAKMKPNEEAEDLIAVYSSRHLPRFHG